MSQFNLGLKALKRFVQEQDALTFHRSKLSEALFRTDEEKKAFLWTTSHLSKFQQLPQLSTFLSQWPEAQQIDTPEPASYYVDLLERRFEYETINRANVQSQDVLKNNKDHTSEALEILEKARDVIINQRYRQKILDFAKDAGKLVLTNYFKLNQDENSVCSFGWDYLDHMCGSVMPGDVISYVGRPASGKTFFMLYSAMHNWLHKHNVLFVSMEMSSLAICQRATSMYAHTNVKQLKTAGYSSVTLKKFMDSMGGLEHEGAKLYIVDGNLAAYVDDVYTLARQLGCAIVCFDGAYLARHRNKRLDRFTRVAENVEMMKQFSGDLDMKTFASWQFNRVAAKKDKKKGEKAGLEDIGYTDAIGQISTVVLGLLQEESVETINQRLVDILKGRNGEVGQFAVNWDFDTMNFSQLEKTGEQNELKQLEFV